jgi:hypothetical protein
MPVSISGTNGVTFPDSSLQAAAASPYVLKNRIINGDMRIAQRGTSAISVSTDPTPRNYPVDRFFCSASGGGVYSTQQSSTVPTGFNNSIINTVTTADSSIAAGDVYYMAQAIEGFNLSDLAWGTADAQTVTLSFWVRSSITGTFSGSIRNSAANRAYVFTYTINAANTWEKETITIAGDTSGTWETTTSAGAFIAWDLGSGTNFNGTASSWTAGNYLRASSATNWIATNGATFYITGVQLEIGSTATPFERRLYNQELANCQRYCYVGTGANCFVAGAAATSTNIYIKYVLPIPMRATPTLSFVSSGANQLVMSDQYVADFGATSPTIITAPNISDINGRVYLGGFSGLTVGRWYGGGPNTTAQSIFSAEL